jgi:fluoroacetyl-CoA thioesterase
MNIESEYLGAVGLATMVIRPGDTAVALGIGELPIAAGSHLLNVMESACVTAIAEYFEGSETTILSGSSIEVLAGVSIGTEIRGMARCVEVNGKELTFECDIYDGERHLAPGQIKRTAVERVSFLARTAAQTLTSAPRIN